MDKPSDKLIFTALIVVAFGCFLMLFLSTGIVLFAPSDVRATEQCQGMVQSLTWGWQGGFTAIAGLLVVRVGQNKKVFPGE